LYTLTKIGTAIYILYFSIEYKLGNKIKYVCILLVFQDTPAYVSFINIVTLSSYIQHYYTTRNIIMINGSNNSNNVEKVLSYA